MTTENPYIAPQVALHDQDLFAESAGGLLALRQRYVHRETTLRAWGVAKLIVAIGIPLWLMLLVAIDLRQGRQVHDVSLGMSFVISICLLVYVLPSIGLMLLCAWARWLQILFSAALFLFGLLMLAQGLHARDGGILAGLLLSVPNASLLYLVGNKATRFVLNARYRHARDITTSTGTLWPMIAKTIAFVVVEILPILALVLLMAIAEAHDLKMEAGAFQ